jgi:alkylation response protein AidB-like acyl-CoA dehydrogenase
MRKAEDEPVPQRRRRGETGRGFGLAARAVLHHTVRVPPQAYAAATAFLADTLDWLQLWQGDGPVGSDALDDRYDTKQDQQFPQP